MIISNPRTTLYNPMLSIDGYKVSHRRQYPRGTQLIYSNWTPRGSRISGINGVVFFGLQYFVQEYLMHRMQEYFFTRPRADIESEYRQFLLRYLGNDDEGVQHISALHELGYVPLKFKALPEGTVCPLRVPMFSVENTLPEFFWVTNYFETIASASIWNACTAATHTYNMRKLANAWCHVSHGDPQILPFQLHGFEFRGMSSHETASVTGAAHLLSSLGTDTVPALSWIDLYYAGEDNHILGMSCPASEHSVVCCGGEGNEISTLGHILDEYPKGIVSYVSDTWNLWDLITVTLVALKDRIVARDGKLVIRPDSGKSPADILCGDPSAELNSPAYKGVVQLLWELFGGTIVGGFKRLNPHIGAIYGDSITHGRAEEIFSRLHAKGFATTNVVLGVGSFTYQYNTRDTFGFAMKSTLACVNGEYRDLSKKPITDSGEKFSAVGRLSVVKEKDNLVLLQSVVSDDKSELKDAWQDGKLLRYQSFDSVRRTLWRQ